MRPDQDTVYREIQNPAIPLLAADQVFARLFVFFGMLADHLNLSLLHLNDLVLQRAGESVKVARQRSDLIRARLLRDRRAVAIRNRLNRRSQPLNRPGDPSQKPCANKQITQEKEYAGLQRLNRDGPDLPRHFRNRDA